VALGSQSLEYDEGQQQIVGIDVLWGQLAPFVDSAKQPSELIFKLSEGVLQIFGWPIEVSPVTLSSDLCLWNDAAVVEIVEVDVTGPLRTQSVGGKIPQIELGDVVIAYFGHWTKRDLCSNATPIKEFAFSRTTKGGIFTPKAPRRGPEPRT
jgi:hypothetical protein